MSRLSRFSCLALLSVSFAAAANADDWIHWRGPTMGGSSLESSLPSEFDPAKKAAGNVLWTAPYGSRSAPLVMDGRVYVFHGYGEGLGEQERLVCVDEKTGKKLWEYEERVYHADIVSNRLGWASMAADAATSYVYAHTTSGNLVCLDKAGKMVWERQLTEEFGRVTGYGGRIVSPIFDSGLVIVGMLNSSWGDQARGANRFIAFDGKTGDVVWINDTGLPLRVTYQSNPVVAVINGQRLMIAGGSDGALHAFKVRSGERVWSYSFSGGAVNPSPVVDGNFVYCAHGEENTDSNQIGRVICVDASKIDPATKKPKLVWEYSRGQRFGLSSPAIANGVLYMPEDSGELYAFDAKTGKVLWKHRYGTEVRGAPLVADGKLFIFEVKGKFSIIPLENNGKSKPNEDDIFTYTFRDTVGGRPVQTETNGTPVAVNGRLYFNSRTDLLCVGDKNVKAGPIKNPPMPEETPFKQGAVASARIFPAEVTAKPGEALKFKVVYMDDNGREVQGDANAKAEWTIVTPGKAPNGAQPPALAATVDGNATQGNVKLGPNPVQQGYVEVKVGNIVARTRIRVAPQIPAATDFDKLPPGASPAGWVNTNGKFFIKKLPDGNNVLMKSNDNARPPIAKANAYITVPQSSDYVIQADFYGTLVRGKLPDAGLINSRYALMFDGKIDPELKKNTVRLTSWEARPRINVVMPFDWLPNTWYTAKLIVEPKEKSATIRGKIWKKGGAEPAEWMLTFEDPYPNRIGSAGLYGYIPNISEEAGGEILPGSELYFDNLSIKPNKAAPPK